MAGDQIRRQRYGGRFCKPELGLQDARVYWRHSRKLFVLETGTSIWRYLFSIQILSCLSLPSIFFSYFFVASGLTTIGNSGAYTPFVEGAVITGTINWDERQVHFFLNKNYVASFNIHKNFTILYPIATMYGSGHVIGVKSVPTLLPPKQLNFINWTTPFGWSLVVFYTKLRHCKQRFAFLLFRVLGPSPNW